MPDIFRIMAYDLRRQHLQIDIGNCSIIQIIIKTWPIAQGSSPLFFAPWFVPLIIQVD